MMFSIKTNSRRGFTISSQQYLQVRSGSYILFISQLNSENVNEQTEGREFENVITDFTRDILNTFPELETTLEDNLKIIISEDENKQEALNKVHEYCKEAYPQKFFDISSCPPEECN